MHTDAVRPGKRCMLEGVDRSSRLSGWMWNCRSGVPPPVWLVVSTYEEAEEEEQEDKLLLLLLLQLLLLLLLPLPFLRRLLRLLGGFECGK